MGGTFKCTDGKNLLSIVKKKLLKSWSSFQKPCFTWLWYKKKTGLNKKKQYIIFPENYYYLVITIFLCF